MKPRHLARLSAPLVVLCALAIAAHAQDGGMDNRGNNGGQDNNGPQVNNDPQANDDPQNQQDNNGGGGAPAVGSSRVSTVDENSLSRLAGLLSRGGGPGAVSLRASEEAFDANVDAKNALLKWVSQGGVVFLHTGAARAFGYETVEARLGSNQLAGQLYGRAHAALPFGASPLLWDTSGTPPRPTRNADPTLLPGVNVVFYQMMEGDHLVVSNPAGTPLLTVADLASNSPSPLYAAAIAPYGKGWAVFTPDSIDQQRADGALFARNLLNLISARASIGPNFVGVAASVIEGAANNPAALRAALADSLKSSSPALPALGTTRSTLPLGVAPLPKRPFGGAPVAAPPVGIPPVVAPPADAVNGNDATANATDGIPNALDDPAPQPGDAQVLLSRAEASAYVGLMGQGDAQIGTVINLLRARLFLARSDFDNVNRSLDAASGLTANTAEVAFWRGVLSAGASQDISQASPARSAELVEAARNFIAAATSPAMVVPAAVAPPQAGNFNNGAMVSGVPVSLLRDWSIRMNRIARVFSLEPPAVQQFGVGDGSITVRAVANDNSLRLVVPGATALSNADNFGWRGDHEEILVFPTPETFNAYRNSLGLTGPTVPIPAGGLGDVLGQRLMFVSLPSLPIVRRDPRTGAVLQLTSGNAALSLLARLHSYVMLNALDQGGSNVPAWFQLGIENLVNNVASGGASTTDAQNLGQFAQAGGLLSPDQFGNANPDGTNIAPQQAASMMTYFYQQYGAGAVVETLQRLGTGENINDALQATTQGDQAAFFQSWRDATFGPQQLPNNN